MHATATFRIGTLVLGVLGAVTAAMAGGPWDRLLSTSRVDADPKKPYALTEKNGPWMIMACSFAGDGAREQAHQLVLELRKRYKLPAYVYEKKFDLGKEPPALGVDEFGRPKKMKYRRGGSEIDEVAVVVGDYSAVDDPDAQETLHQLKYLQPECLTLAEGKATYQNLACLRWMQRAVLAGDNPKKKKGPMGHAFVTTNPVLPSDYYVPKGLDPLIVKANEGVEHSLLDCPGKYTVQVAHFTGRVIMDQRKIEAIENGAAMQSRLADAAEKAHRLTQALRMKGYEAYEFHDRYASIVTVGSFDSTGQRGPNGVLQLDPRIKAVFDQFKGEAGANGALAPKMLVKIPFDARPILVHVPKPSLAAALSHSPVRTR